MALSRAAFFSRYRRLASWGAIALGVSVWTRADIAAASEEDRATATTALREVAASGHEAAAKEAVDKAREASECAVRLHDVRDEVRANLCEGLARTWAETARDIVRAVGAEADAEKSREASAAARVQAERERTLVEEAIAQEGRLRAQVAKAKEDQKKDTASHVARESETPKSTSNKPSVPTKTTKGNKR